MEIFELKSVSVDKDLMILDGMADNSNLVFYNKYSKFTWNVENSSINIAEFIERNEICIQENSLFTLAVETENGVNNLSPFTTNANCIIYKNIEISTQKYTYSINLLTTESNELQVEIKRLTPNNAQIKINNLHINNSLLTFSIEKVGARFIDEVGVLLTNNHGGVQGITCFNCKGNIALFEINLEELSNLENTYYSTNLVLDEQILPLRFDQTFKLNNTSFEREDGLCIVTAEMNEYRDLTISTSSSLVLNPVLLSTTYVEDKFTIKGSINSNVNYTKYNDYTTIFKLTSMDGSKSILEEVSIDKGVFTFELSNKDLLELKDTDYNQWSTSISVHKGDIELCNATIVCSDTFNSISETISEDEYTASLMVSNSEDNQLLLQVKGSLTIEQILSIYKKGRNLVVKYRTVERIDKLISTNSLKTNIKVGTELLTCKQIVGKGKKTYKCVYKTKKPNEVLDTILEKGLVLISQVKDIKVSQTMPEVNEMVIYRNLTQLVQNTKKYKNLTAKSYRKLFLKLPINKKKVMFESFLGRNVSGNPKYIYEYMVQQGLDNEYKLVWILNDLNEDIQGKHKKVKRKSLKYYYHMATSAYWIFNVRQGDEIVKRAGTKYLQCWHGTALKRLASDMTNVDMGGVTDLTAYKLKFFNNTRRWDYLLTQNDYSEEIFRRAFNFNKRFIPGYPANDILYTKNNKTGITRIKEKLGLPLNKKIIMYAPTWREDNFYKKGQYKLELELELDKMQEALGDEYIVVLRAHYLIANSINISKYKDFVFDYSKGYDIQELYLATDILITDYSSVMFDFANLKRPMIFFMYDLEKYRDSLRGFYFDFEKTAPGPIVKTTEGIINSIQNIDTINEEYRELRKDFYNKFCHIDNGKSAKKVVDVLFFDK